MQPTILILSLRGAVFATKQSPERLAEIAAAENAASPPPKASAAPKKFREGDTASRLLEKQPPGRAGDCFASLAMTVSDREKSGPALLRYSQ